MTSRVRIGVIGTSWFADEVHLPCLCSHPAAAVVALCGRRQEHTAALAARFGIPEVYADYREMLAAARLDAVVVVAPDDLHYEMVMAALSRGLHVLCEKPLALTAAEARAMYERAESAGVVHMTFFTYRWLPEHRYMHALLDQGYVGRPYHCQLRQLTGYGRQPAYNWRFDRRRANGLLADLGSHMIDLARWHVGEITHVAARLGVFVPRPDVDGGPLDPANDAAALLVEFANGAHGTLQVSAVMHEGDRGALHNVEIYGEDGSLELDFPFGPRATLRGIRAGAKQVETFALPADLLAGEDARPPFAGRFGRGWGSTSIADRAFVDAIVAGRPASPGFYDGWRTQAVIDAAIASHETGRWVRVE